MGTRYLRYVALGDSQSEGLNDVEGSEGPRGWADRFAETLARSTSPGLAYANLAVRRARARDVLDKQLPVALDLAPDLATVVVGMNDLLRPDFDLDATVTDVARAFESLRATGCHVATMTFPDIAQVLPVLGWLRPRQADLNRRLSEAARDHRVAVLDLFPLVLSADPSMWSHDRVHASSLGHARLAAGMAHLFDLPGSDQSWAVPVAEPPISRVHVVRREAHWLATFAVPFLAKQLVRRHLSISSAAKRPALLPVLLEDAGSLVGTMITR